MRAEPDPAWSGPVPLYEALETAVALSELDLLSKEVAQIERDIATFREEAGRMEFDILEFQERDATSRRDLEWLEQRVAELRALNQSLFRERDIRREGR